MVTEKHGKRDTFLVKLCKKPHFVCISNWQGLNVQQPHVGDFKLALKAQALICIFLFTKCIIITPAIPF